MKKIAVITCYHDPDYVRARALRAAMSEQPDVSTIVIKNKHKGILRYPEVLWLVARTKWRDRPDALLLTFRGQEILPFILLIAWKTPVWFDEFIVPTAYAKQEKHRKTFKKRLIGLAISMTSPAYQLCLKRCQMILSDTPSHAELSAKLNKVNHRKYLPIPVGTDDKLFKPKDETKASPFQIFYYTTDMQPLHGIAYVLEAAERLSDDNRFQFLLVGGKKAMESAVKQSVKRGASIVYKSWVPFGDMPSLMRKSGLSLGGPFGGTPQAEHVITGKTYQSIACAVPTVIGSNPDVDAYFKDKINAIVVPQKDTDALVKAFKWAIEHPKELKTIGQKGRSLYESQFSKTALARRIRPLIESIK